MRHSNNVLQFPSDNLNGSNLKGFAILFYLFVAYMLTLGAGLAEGGLGILVLLGMLYNFFIKRRIHKTSYFKDNRVLLSILLVVFLVIYKLTFVLILIMGGLYWVLVERNVREAPYFLKFHMLTALIFNFFLIMPYLILNAVLVLASHCLLLLHQNAIGALVTGLSNSTIPLFMMGLLWSAALWLSFSVILGRTPYIGVITNNVRHWT